MTPDLERRLAQGAAPRPRSKPGLRVGVLVVGLIVLGLVVSQLQLERDLRRLDAGFLSGLPEGNYHAISVELVRRAAALRGQLREVASEGSADNIARLRAARGSC